MAQGQATKVKKKKEVGFLKRAAQSSSRRAEVNRGQTARGVRTLMRRLPHGHHPPATATARGQSSPSPTMSAIGPGHYQERAAREPPPTATSRASRWPTNGVQSESRRSRRGFSPLFGSCRFL